MASIDEAPAPLVLVTGATGFVGRALCDALPGSGFRVRRALRTPVESPDDFAVGPLGRDTEWRAALAGVDYVVHLAAHTHVPEGAEADTLDAYRAINVEATRTLAEAAASAGIRRFVFMSSVKVNGEATAAPFGEHDPPRPENAYGRTKLEAEILLDAIASGSSMETVSLRPPLVYGRGVKGNFLRLMRLIARGAPLPLGSIENRRSIIYVGNLADAVIACVRAERVSRTYLVADDEAPSTPDLARAIGAALGAPARIVKFPVALLRALGALTGRSAEIARLTRSLEIDTTRIKTELAWRPLTSLERGLAEAAQWYHAQLGARPLTE